MIDVLAAASLVLLLDQWSKRVVRLRLAHRPVNFGRIVRIRRVISAKESYNRRGARAGLVVIWLVALACATMLYASGRSYPSSLGMGVALGGAAGNLLDILCRRSVLDFIDLRWWPVFNVADVGIVVGLALAFWPLA